MKPAILVLCCALAMARSASPVPKTKPQAGTSSSDQKSEAQGSPVFRNDRDALEGATDARARKMEQLDILSDTQGVDFGPYLKGILPIVRKNWYMLIPESAETKKGKLAIEFAIAKDGHVADMRLVASSGDIGLDRPAWGSITNSNPFPALPSAFKGKYLALRFRYYYNPDKHNLDPHPLEAHLTGIQVSIFSPPKLDVSVGGSQVVAATVNGTKDKAVEWTITGSGCSGATCGKMSGDLYIAPEVLPDPPEVTLTAASKADPNATASIIFHIVQPTQSH